jgi:cytochrome c
MKPIYCFFLSSLVFAATTSFLAAEDAPRRGVKNDQEPWVFRTVLDARPRVLVAALDDSLWAAWDTQRCRLFQVWKPGEQGVKLQGAAFDGAHGPQPVSDGSRMHEEPAEPAWYLPGKGEPTTAVVRYRSHRTGKPGELTLSYQVILDEQKAVVAVEETPSFVAGSAASLSRKFLIKGLPDGKQIALRVSGDASVWSASGVAGELKATGEYRYLVIRKNGEVTLLGSWKNH